MPTIGGAQRFALDGSVVGQVGSSDQTTLALHVAFDPRGDFTAVKGVGTALGDLIECPGQIRLLQTLARAVSTPIGLEEGTASGLTRLQSLLSPTEDERLIGAQHHAIASECGSRRDQLRPGQLAVSLVSELKPRDRAGYGGGAISDRGALALLTLVVEKHLELRGLRRDATKIDRRDFLLAGHVGRQKAIATDVARARQRHGQGESHRYRRIDGVTPFGQNPRPYGARDLILRDHHALQTHLGRVDARVLEQRLALRRRLTCKDAQQ